MSKVEVNTIEPQCGTTLTVGKCTTSVAVPGNVVKSNALQASDGGNIVSQSGTDITLGASGDTINLASGASQSGFGRTGTVDWVTTPKVTGDSPVTAATGSGYFLNTTAGVITINLPAGAAGSIVSMADYAATWQTNNVTVTPNGSEKIGGEPSNATLDTEGQSVTFVYVDSTQGWVNTMDSTSNVRGAPPFMVATGGTITCCGDYKTHIFTGPGTFCVSAAAPTAPLNLVDYVVVAGGGGTFRGLSGGGGAGGFRIFSTAPGCNSPLNNSGASPNTEVTVTASPYSIVVGGGGSPGPAGSAGGATSGATSTFSTVDSAGGGKGGTSGNGPGDLAGTAGGSGGGGDYNAATIPGGAGNTPPVSPSQGSAGSNGNPAPSYAPGGGGGASAAGGPSPVTPGGDGSYIADPFIGPTAPTYGTPGPVGSTRYFAGGGGGAYTPSTDAGAGGAGGGGTRTPRGTPDTGGNGDTNTGGGGQGGAPGSVAGGGGGSGIVMIRYKYQ